MVPGGCSMRANEKPSILAVCIPGIDAAPDAMDFGDVVAAYERGAWTKQEANDAPVCGASGKKCEACDDSACGIDAMSENMPSSVRGMAGATKSSFDRTIAVIQLDGEIAGDSNASLFLVDSGKKALELMRMFRFDLLVTGDVLPDMPVSHLLRRVRAAWPWQKWAIVGSSITTQDEIAARTLGALAVFDAPADWNAITSMAAFVAGKTAANADSSAAQSERDERFVRARFIPRARAALSRPVPVSVAALS